MFLMLLFMGFVPLQQRKGTPVVVKIETTKSVDVVLHKFLLDGYACNIAEFYRLNRLSKNQTLTRGDYILPVLKYDYDGNSIRSSIGVSDRDYALKVQEYNDELVKAGVRTQNYKASRVIYVPYHLKNCPAKIVRETKPEMALSSSPDYPSAPSTTGKTRTFAIFGREHQRVAIESSRLKGRIFYVESGHGGPDPGAQAQVGGHTLCEDEYAYDVALRVARELIKHQATVYIITRDPNDGIRGSEYLTCDSDEVTFPTLRIPVGQKERLTQRSDAINKIYDENAARGVKNQRLIVIHVDSRGQKEQTDTFLYYQDGVEESLTLGRKMLSTLRQKYSSRREYNGTLSTRDLHMLRECKPITVFVEIGNIRNALDRQRLIIPSNREAIARWLAEGFVK